MKVEERRRLTELYVLGEEVQFSWEPPGEDVIYVENIWIRKLTPVEVETAYARASAIRSSVLAMKNEKPPSDQFITLKQDVADMDSTVLKLWAVSTDLGRKRPEIEARVAHENDWMKENYLSGLYERAGSQEFKAKMEENPDDPEVKRVVGEIDRFSEEVEDAVALEMADIDAMYDTYPPERLHDYVLEELIKMQADASWLVEYKRCQIWLGARESDKHSEAYFKTRQEVDLLQVEALRLLEEAVERVNVTDSEGKDLPLIPTS